MNEDRRGGGLGNHPGVIVVGLVAAAITIVGFINGKQKLKDYFDITVEDQKPQIDEKPSTAVASVPLTSKPFQKETLYVLGYTYEGLFRVDPNSATILSRSPLQAVNGIAMAWNDKANEIYALLQNGSTIPVIDPESGEQKGAFLGGIGWNGYSLAVASEGGIAVGGFVNTEGSYVSVFDASTYSLIKSMPIDTPCCPYAAVKPDGSRIYVSSGRGISVYSYPQFDQIDSGEAAGLQGGRLLLTPDGGSLFLAQQGWVARIDTSTMAIAEQISIPGLSSDSRLLITKDGSELWMTSGRGAASIFSAPGTLATYERYVIPGDPLDFCLSQDERRIFITAQKNEGSLWSFDRESKKFAELIKNMKILPTALFSLPAN